MQISGDAENIELKGVGGVKLNKELEQDIDVIEKRKEVQKSAKVNEITKMQI